MCCNNMNRSSCGCGCGCGGNRSSNRCGCGCGCCCNHDHDCGCNGGVSTLPSFPDWPAFERVEREFPVYISVPATMSRGTANFSAAVEMMEESCGCSRG